MIVVIVVIVVIAVVRASSGSSSSRLAVVVVAVVVGNMCALILKHNPNPNQDAFFRFRPGCELRIEPARPACVPAKQAARAPTNRDHLPQVGLRRVLGCRGASHASIVAPCQRPRVLGGVPRRVRRHGLPRTGAATPAVLSRRGRRCAQVLSRPRSPARPLLCYELQYLKTVEKKTAVVIISNFAAMTGVLRNLHLLTYGERAR